ncbi:hypothetical protein ACLOJK_001746 [Asimina triloba]
MKLSLYDSPSSANLPSLSRSAGLDTKPGRLSPAGVTARSTPLAEEDEEQETDTRVLRRCTKGLGVAPQNSGRRSATLQLRSSISLSRLCLVRVLRGCR